MYADKVIGYFDIHVQYQFKHYIDLDVFLWTIGQTVAVLLLVLSFFFKPYKWSLLSPLVVFTMQFLYVWRDEEWVQHEYYFLYTVIFLATILGAIYFARYVIVRIGSILQASRKKDVDTLVNFVVEIRNDHYKKILKSANSLELMHETEYSLEEKERLMQIINREIYSNTKQFEIRIVQTLHGIDD